MAINGVTIILTYTSIGKLFKIFQTLKPLHHLNTNLAGVLHGYDKFLASYER